jgi:hypothetical protein
VADMPTRQNVIDLVQSRQAYVLNNVMEDCKFMTQISCQAEVGETFNDIVIRGNIIKGIGAETTSASIVMETRSTNLVVANNIIQGGTGRAISVGNCDNFLVNDNIIDLKQNTSTAAGGAVISTTSASSKGVITGNVYTGEQRDCFVRIEGLNTVVTINHVKSQTPYHRLPSSDQNTLISDNSIDGSGYVAGTLQQSIAGGTYYFTDNNVLRPGYLTDTALSNLDNINIRAGQIVLNVGTSGPLAWRATTTGLGSVVVWESLGDVIP